MFKKIFTIVSTLLIGIGTVIGLGSCSKNTDSVEVKSFTTDKTAYIEGEDIIFDIGISADSNYTILTAEIKPDSADAFTIDLLSDDGYHYTGKKTYDGSSIQYTLKTIGFTYIKDEDIHSDSLEVRGFNIKTLTSDDDSSNIALSSMTISNPENNADYYIGQTINVFLKFNNPDEAKISGFTFTYSNETSGDITISKSNVVFSNPTEYEFEIELPGDAYGAGKLTLTKIVYINTKTLKATTTTLSNEKTVSCDLTLKVREITLQSINLSVTGLSNYTTVDGVYTFEKGTTLPISLNVYNPNRNTIIGVTINGTNYFPASSTHNSITEVTSLKVNVAPSTATATLDLIEIKVEKIEFNTGNLTINYKPSSSITGVKIRSVNKIISSKEDLQVLFANGTVTGYNLVTKSIDLGNSCLHASKLEGTLDFQGNLLSNYKTTKPMFDTITETGVLKNIYMNQVTVSTTDDLTNYYSGLLTTTNNGLINNIKISNLKLIANASHNHLKEGNKYYTEIGLVKTNSETGVIKNLDIATTLYSTGVDGLFYDYSPIFVENYGQIACVYTYITSVSTLSDLKTGFYLSGRINQGTLSGLIFDFNCSEEQLTTTLLYTQPKDGNTSGSIITNQTLLNLYKSKFDIPEWDNKTNPYDTLIDNAKEATRYVETETLGGGDSTAQYLLFSSLEFEQSGNGFVWVYGNNTGKPYLIYKK